MAARLRNWLIARGVEPRELADAVGVFPFLVSLWLDGQCLPTPDQGEQIGAYLRVDDEPFWRE